MRFVPILGVCCTKEWVARVPGGWDEPLWLLMQIESLGEADTEQADGTSDELFEIRLYESFNGVDWVGANAHYDGGGAMDILVGQCFLRRPPIWSKLGVEPLGLMVDAVRFADDTYLTEVACSAKVLA